MVDIEHGYAAICPKCGAIVGATLDDPEHRFEVSRFAFEALGDGFRLERMTVEDIRPRFGPCRCPGKAAE